MNVLKRWNPSAAKKGKRGSNSSNMALMSFRTFVKWLKNLQELIRNSTPWKRSTLTSKVMSLKRRYMLLASKEKTFIDQFSNLGHRMPQSFSITPFSISGRSLTRNMPSLWMGQSQEAHWLMSQPILTSFITCVKMMSGIILWAMVMRRLWTWKTKNSSMSRSDGSIKTIGIGKLLLNAMNDT